MKQAWTTVVSIEFEDNERQHLVVKTEDDTLASVINYLSLCKACAIGDSILVNLTASELDLGTKADFVIANADTRPYESNSGGHAIKLRYTPLQKDVLAIEETPLHHAAIKEASSLNEMPIVVCELASQIPALAYGIKSKNPEANIVHIMTDEGSLMYQLSEIFRHCQENKLIDISISAGQAMGADYEAVNRHSAMLAAKHALSADVAIVSIGPGVLGTDTRFGHGGIAQAETLNAAIALGGKPISVARMSFAEGRQRHFGLSHHFLTALSICTLGKTTICIPAQLDKSEAQFIEDQLKTHHIYDLHEVIKVDGNLENLKQGLPFTVRSMGRNLVEDPMFFLSPYTTGLYVGNLILTSAQSLPQSLLAEDNYSKNPKNKNNRIPTEKQTKQL